MLRIEFHPGVTKDIKASYQWYENQYKGLGDDFLNEVERAQKVLLETPDTWPYFQNSFQRYLLNKFPFSIIYRRCGDTLFVLAVMHNSRKPDFWHNRI